MGIFIGASAKIGFIPPTFGEYLKFKFALPSWKEAHLWSVLRMGGGPMSESEYAGYLNMTDDLEWNKKNADSINRARSRTTSGWYLWGWIMFAQRVYSLSYHEFIEMKYDEALQRYYDEREYRMQSDDPVSDDYDDWASEDMSSAQYDLTADNDYEYERLLTAHQGD